MAMQVQVVSPERILFEGEAEMVIARTVDTGDIAFLSGHAPFLGALDIAPVTIRPIDGDDQLAAVHGGFVSVSNDRVIVLSDIAELSDQIDLDRARRAHERAERAVADHDDAEADAALKRAHARLVTVDGLSE